MAEREADRRDEHAQRAEATTDWLRQLPVPAAVLGPCGELLRWNDEAASLLGVKPGRPASPVRPGSRWFDRVRAGVEAAGRARTIISRRTAAGRTALDMRFSALAGNELLVLLTDCTAQVVRRRQRRSRERSLRGFLDRLPEPVMIEQGGVIAYANDAAAKLCGAADASALTGSPVTTILSPAVADRIRTVMDATSALAPSELETVIGAESGSSRNVQVSPLPLTYRGRPAMQLVMRDVTEQRRAEENLRRSEEQLRHAQKMDVFGRLAAGIAHDFNNLLTAIQGHAQFLLEDLQESSSAHEDATEIRRAADRATELTRQLLTFARREPVRAQPVNINAVVGELEKLLRRLLRADIELATELHPDLPMTLADRGQLEQVIVNIVVNARDAMEHGGAITIRTGVMHFDSVYTARGLNLPAGGYVVLAISDNGKGMSPELQEQIFEPFFTTKKEGTGLGLPTVSGIVQQTGGYMSLYSEEDIGTTFKVFLPLNDEAAAAQAGTSDWTDADAGTGDPISGKVLIVDDDEGLLDMTSRTLRDAGYSVVAAESGEAALQLARTEAECLAVVVTDMMMPEMTGEQLMQRITAECPAAGVVLMSGFSEASLLLESHGPGRHHFLEKPFTRGTLLSAVRSAAQRARD